METTKNELMVKESGYLSDGEDISSYEDDMFEDLDFDRIKIPAGGGLAYEVPGDDADSPDMAKEFSAVILYHHPINVYYKDKYDGANNPPDCSSYDGKTGIDTDGVVNQCTYCPNAKFGSANDGSGKACKEKRRIFILREGNMFPILMTLPTGSIGEFKKYIMRLINKRMHSNGVVTKFSLKRVQNSSGINYSQAIFSVDRVLTPEEYAVIKVKSGQIKALANQTAMTSEE